MPIIEKCNISRYHNPISEYKGNFQTGTKKSKIAEYFDYLYSYPPKFKIKWNAVDELNGDLFLNPNYGVLKHSFPFIDFIEDWTFDGTEDELASSNYKLSQYIDGYLDKLNSSKFYRQQTDDIQKALANVPVYTVLNGRGEIVLNKPTKISGSKEFNYINQVLYDFCGAFDAKVEKRPQLGLFFLNYEDAKNYLQEVARADIDGTKRLGLSIHCVGLDSAYKITREHHPGIDFRFIPNFTEVKELLTKNIAGPDTIVENGQQQLRFRRRTVNLFPYLGKVGSLLSPSFSLLHGNDYFKGVPIYIVQVAETSRSNLTEQYLKTLGIFDTIFCSATIIADIPLGFGLNWISQGSLSDLTKSEQLTNFIFFEKSEAAKFVKEQGTKVDRYPGSKTGTLEAFVQKPKIYVYNLEDFIESWEDKIYTELNEDSSQTIQPVFEAKATYFIPPTNQTINSSQNYKVSKINSVKLALRLKYQNLKRFVGVFFSVS
jgi:hypothetical protein